jgi:hypothetical protein
LWGIALAMPLAAAIWGLQPLSNFHLNDDISIELDDIARPARTRVF